MPLLQQYPSFPFQIATCMGKNGSESGRWRMISVIPVLRGPIPLIKLFWIDIIPGDLLLIRPAMEGMVQGEARLKYPGIHSNTHGHPYQAVCTDRGYTG
jgi:hypothetical protein